MLGKQVCLKVWVKSPLQKSMASEKGVCITTEWLSVSQNFKVKTEYTVLLYE